ncbi:hypothetical protein LRAMOSA01942 [Lichtheimia ramosa]|uniref:Fe2OG dioxygenase domain-containing protein n=1 Tax=Lichtheimia ramosa TaxID=688394 RepID=A0A077WLH9_9FUNG|nr:hypothetical protein LRAMOSA01942 [Lichtheimia ramosa]
MVRNIPVIDFADFDSDPKKVAGQVLDACKSIGFFYIINHDLPKDQIDKSFQLAKEFFDLPKAEKRRYLIQEDNHGYSELYSETLDPEHQRQGDHKEGFNFRNFVDGKAFRELPEVFAKDQQFVEGFSRACHAVAMRVLEAFAIALEIPEEHGGASWFKDRHPYDKQSGQILRFLKYPRGGEEAYQEPVRAGAHSDYGSITLLFQRDVPGLEVQASRTEWISAPLIKDAILVNVGDQIEFWTNGLFKSTMHRVVFLPEHAHVDRYSIPFFVHPSDETLLAPIPSTIVPPATNRNEDEIITAEEHLRRRLDATYKYEKPTHN